MTDGTRRACVDCGAGFLVTEGEVSFYAQRALVLPKRCAPCRRARKIGAPAGRGDVVVIHDDGRRRRDGGGHADGRR